MTDSLTKEEKFEDFIGDEVCARRHSLKSLETAPIEIEDGCGSMWLSLSDAAALRDWLNKVLP